jgi:stress-induced-phosphoprotein 1
MALQNLGRFDDAIATFEQGLKLNPDNAQIKQGLDQCRMEKAAAGTDDAGGMFGPEAMVKLMSNPRIAGYFQDPKFRNSFEMCKKDPQMLMQIIQIDPRFMDVFKELTGIDLLDMQSQQMKAKDKQEDFRKRNEELAAKKRAEDEARHKQEEEEKLSPEERDKIARKKQAEAVKNEGNEFYKKKQFAEALKKYDEALQLDENEITYINNKATAYFEMKDYEKCIEECDKAIQKSKEGYYDYVKLGKALARKAGAMAAQG